MGLAWQLQTLYRISLLWLAVSASESHFAAPETVYVAYSRNFINLTYDGNLTFYKSVVNQTVEDHFFQEVDGLDCDGTNQMVCWVEHAYSIVRCSSPWSGILCRNETNHFTVTTVVAEGQPLDVALDPCRNMLYWTDPFRSTIGAASLKRTYFDRIYAVAIADILTAADGLYEPTSIAVDSCEGYIFFTDVDASVHRVAKVPIDGSLKVSTLVDVAPPLPKHTSPRPLRYPTALALDRESKHIYFGDRQLGEIYKMTYDGGDLTIVTEAITVYDIALGCNNERIVYSSWTSLYPNVVSFDGTGQHRLILHLIGPKTYHGACSYCNSCLCETACSNDNGGCSHLCFERPNSNEPKCGCPAGYILHPDNDKQCIVETPQLLVANKSNIFLIKLNSNCEMDGKLTKLWLRSSAAYGLDYVEHGDRQYVVFADKSSLKLVNFDGSDRATLANSLGNPRGVAVDCITGNVYCCQMTKGVISITNLNGTIHYICHSDILKPFEVVLNTKKGTLFYTSLGLPYIYSASMDCTGNPMRTKAKPVAVPTGVALDGSRQILYWVDFAYGQVQSYDLKTHKTSLVVSRSHLHLYRPVELTLCNDHLYFTSLSSGCVGSVSIKTNNISDVLCIPGSTMHGITHLPKQCQNPENGGSCNCGDSQMCVLSPGGSVKCQCPLGFHYKNEKCQLPSEPFILVSARHSIVALSLSPGKWITQLPLPSQKNIIALDIDNYYEVVFWTDVDLRKIFSANLDGTDIKALLVHDPNRDACRLCVPDGLFYDTGDDKQRLYYTDTEAGEICYIHIIVSKQNVRINEEDPRPVLVLGGLDKPRAIVIDDGHPRKLYFSEWGSSPRISSVVIDKGKAQSLPPVPLVSHNLKLPNALALNKNGEWLYFADAGKDYIAAYDIKNGMVRVLSNATHVHDMVMYTGSHNNEPQLIWSDWVDGVSKMSLNVGPSSIVSLASSTDVHWASGIKVFSPPPR